MTVYFASILVAVTLVAKVVVPSSGAFVAQVVSPANGSTVGHLTGSVDPVVFECNIRGEQDGQIVTTSWTLQNYRGVSGERFVVQSDFLDVFSISGDIRPAGSTYRNRLTVLNFTEELDGTVLRCKYSRKVLAINEGLFYLRVYRPPQLLQISEVVDVIEYEEHNISLEVGPKAFPYPRSLQWTRDGVKIGNSTTARFGYPAVSFTNVSQSDAGRYTLTATNYQLDDPSLVIGTAVGSFELNVKFGPDLSRGPGVVYRALNQEAILVCGSSVQSNPAATVAWNDNLGRAVSIAKARFRQDNLLSLSVSELTLADAGVWTCVVTVAGVGVVRHSIELVVIAPPSPPRDVTVVSTGSTWARVTWSPVVPNPSSATILYNVTATTPGGVVISRTQVNSSTSATVTGLLPNIRYSFAVIASTCAGSVKVPSALNMSASAVTKVTAPKLECSDASAENGAVRLQWDFVHTGGLNLSGVVVSYRSGGSQDFRPVLGHEMRLDAEGRPTSLDVRNLTAGETYVFMINASNEQGSAMDCCPPVTLSIGIPQAPQILQGYSSRGKVVLEVSTKVSGTPPSGGFRFVVRAEHLFASEEIAFSLESKGYVDGEVATLTLSDFPTNEGVEPTYKFYVRCQNSFGTSNESDPRTETVDYSSFPETLVGGSSVGGAVLVVVVVIIAILLLCLCRRKRCKNRRTVHFHEDRRTNADSSPAELNRGVEENVEASATPISSSAHLHRLNTDSAPSSRPESFNRTDSGGGSYLMRQINHYHQRSSSSLSSATPSDAVQERISMCVLAGKDPLMVDVPSAIVHSRYMSPSRTAGKQQKVSATNPLPSSSPLVLYEFANHATCRNSSPLYRSMASGGPASFTDLRCGMNRQFHTSSLCQDSLDQTSNLDSPLSEIRISQGLTRQNSEMYSYHPTSSLV